MSEGKENIQGSKYNPIELLKNMGWFSRLCLIGGILMVIDAILEIGTSPYGYLVLILSLGIIVISFEMQDENQYAYVYAILILVLNYLCHVQFHIFVDVEWTTGLGYIGSIFISIGATLALVLVILSVAASVNKDPIRDIWLFLIGYILLAVNLLVYYLYVQKTVLDFSMMLAILYFSIISICFIFMLLGQKIIGGFTIWLISIITFISGFFGGPLSTYVTGFGAGMILIGNIAFLYFLNEFLLLLTEKDDMKYNYIVQRA